MNATLDFECQVESADFNGDGRDDIVITNAEELNDSSATSGKPDSVRVYLSPANPSGSSAWKEIILINQYFAWHSCEVGDIDNDNDPDVVTGTSNVGKGGSAPDMIVAFLNNGSGTAFTQKKIDGSLPMYNASLGDVDQDGDLDLLAPHFWSSGQIRFFENTSTAASPSTTNAAPVAAALADVTTGEIPLTVYFDGLDSYDDDGVITAYDWRFGDGGASTDASPTHTFTQPGSYQVTLTVTDDMGATDRDTLSIATQNADETFTEVDDNDGLVVWKGTWGLDHNDRYTVGAYNNTLHWSKQLGATGELTFTGTWVRLYCKTATNGNNIRVSVDGTAVETINLNGNGEQQQLVYEQTGLAYGSHTIKVECRGTYVHVDFFEYGD